VITIVVADELVYDFVCGDGRIFFDSLVQTGCRYFVSFECENEFRFVMKVVKHLVFLEFKILHRVCEMVCRIFFLNKEKSNFDLNQRDTVLYNAIDQLILH
jgi:hypothetical protein